GMAYEPSVKVTVVENRKKITLTEGADYDIEYLNNVTAGTGTVLVKGSGSYTGTLKATFQITPKSVKKLKVVTGSITTDNSTTELPVYVYDGSKRLQKGVDYSLSGVSNLTGKSAKSVKITITAAGNYKDSRTVSLPIYDTNAAHIINGENVTLQPTTMQYTGKQLKPVPIVEIGGTPLSSKDYKVQYQNNTNAGTAYVIVTGKGAYRGKVVVPFTITPLNFFINFHKCSLYIFYSTPCILHISFHVSHIIFHLLRYYQCPAAFHIYSFYNFYIRFFSFLRRLIPQFCNNEHTSFYITFTWYTLILITFTLTIFLPQKIRQFHTLIPALATYFTFLFIC
ncbi:MAG: hypothetical protein K2N90_12810, partial [Lachnospiraceae bacterium]|nr:hypothetical protein [Lachnospiraceae bacterium]